MKKAAGTDDDAHLRKGRCAAERPARLLRNAGGFTLIELLVVVAVIGILAAIAVPQYDAFRQRGFDARANLDIRNAAIAQEARYATNGSYVTCFDSACNSPTLPGFVLSDTVRLLMFRFGSGASSWYFAWTWSDSGSGAFFLWQSNMGGML